MKIQKAKKKRKYDAIKLISNRKKGIFVSSLENLNFKYLIY